MVLLCSTCDRFPHLSRASFNLGKCKSLDLCILCELWVLASVLQSLLGMIAQHKQVYKRSPFGNGLVNTTLCGRENKAADWGNKDEEIVTCKLCLAIMKDPQHWRHNGIVTDISGY